jgi:cell division protein DivIC
MKIITFFNSKKFFLLNIFFVLYIATNLTGGERGLLSYFDKKKIKEQLLEKEILLINKLEKLENKNKLLSESVNLDYLDILYREKLKYGKKDEILIKLK